MAHLEEYSYPQMPENISRVYFGLIMNVTNAASIRSRIIGAASATGAQGEAEREALNYAFIDAKMITSREHILAAIYVALVAAGHSALTTKTVHSEILWALNYSNNITESIRRFGVSDTTTALIVVHVGGPREDTIYEQIKSVVAGDWASMDELPKLTDITAIKKYYKLNADPILAKKGRLANTDEETQRPIIDEIVISSVAMKSVLA